MCGGNETCTESEGSEESERGEACEGRETNK